MILTKMTLSHAQFKVNLKVYTQVCIKPVTK